MKKIMFSLLALMFLAPLVPQADAQVVIAVGHRHHYRHHYHHYHHYNR
jgi:hypothetical protein